MTRLLIVGLLTLPSLHCQPSWEGLAKEYREKMANPSNPIAILKTNHGKIVLELYADSAPATVNTIAGLANGTLEYQQPGLQNKTTGHYYDGLIFHRVIPGFMIQGGDIAGNGSGGPGFKFADEINAKQLGLDKVTVGESMGYMRDLQNLHQNKIRNRLFKKYNIKSQADLNKNLPAIEKEFGILMQKALENDAKQPVLTLLESLGYQFSDQLPSRPMARFSVAMANAGPNTNGSQFFINVADNSFLNGKHTNFGQVIAGSEIVQEISDVERDKTDKPVEAVTIESLRVYFTDEPKQN